MKKQSNTPAGLKENARVLVVEDNLLNQKADAFLLSQWGLDFEICDNGIDALSLLRRRHFDLVLMDLRMEDLDGYETTKLIRNKMKNTVPVIGVTAHASDDEAAHCLAAGLNGYLTKPVDSGKLFALIYDHLAVRKLAAVTGEIKNELRKW